MPVQPGDSPQPRRWTGVVAWLIVLLPWTLVLALCLHWEPVLRDGWGNYLWYRAGGQLTWKSVWDNAWGTYWGGNPRLGQAITFVLFAPSDLHVWMTTPMLLCSFWLLTALALGRWPSVRRASDAWLFASVAAMLLIAVPQLGPMYVYRPFVGNYVYGFFFHLVLYLPYRTFAERPGRYRAWLAPALLLWGVAAGLTNEHTGPASLVLLGAAIAWFWRRGDRLAAWMFAGLVGLAAGYALLYFAPGQALRYQGLATQQSLLQRILTRSPLESIRIARTFVVAALATMPWWLISAWTRRHFRIVAPVVDRRVAQAAFAAGCLMVLALYGSPKYGPRLYFAPTAMAVVAAAGWARAALERRGPRACLLALMLGVTGYGFATLLRTYHAVGQEFRHRLEVLSEAAPATAVVVPGYSVPPSRWFLGDDFVSPELRAVVAETLRLASIGLERKPP